MIKKLIDQDITNSSLKKIINIKFLNIFKNWYDK